MTRSDRDEQIQCLASKMLRVRSLEEASVEWGLLSKRNCDRLQISIKTVETHTAKGMRKLEMKSRIDVVRYAPLQRWPQDT